MSEKDCHNLSFILTQSLNPHCKPEQVEPAYIECWNGAAAMQVSQVNLFELGPTWFCIVVYLYG